MDCVNHSGVPATAYCQNCGKALCANCVRNAPGGQILCEPCWMGWRSVQQPFAGLPLDAPNPAVAAALGIIPGVGAMYNGQFLKGLIHVFIFAVLVSTTGHLHIFGLFIPAWILYQVFEAYHTATARRDGQPLPDPLGLNEVSNWLNLSGRPTHGGQPGAAPGPASPGGVNPGGMNPGAGAPYAAGPYSTEPGASSYQQPSWQPPYQGPTGAGYPNPYANPGVPPVPPIPPVPPVPPLYWRRKEPIGAVILIALGLMFLLGQLDLFSGRVFEFAWPLMLIGLGAWLIVRRMQDSQGGPR
jgi:TM2 domain-containing membrane protein YozV